MSIQDMVMQQLGTKGVEAIAGQLGVDAATARGGVTAAVTVLTGALAHNASKGDGAASLDQALEKDHDGSILDNVLGFLGNAAAGPGAGILGHVLGSNKPQVEAAVAEKSGLPMDKVAMLLVSVAPLVMGAIGKIKKDASLDASGVADTLASEQQQAARNDDGLLGSVLGILGNASGGGGGGGAQPAAGGQSSGGILDTITGLFSRKGK